VRERERERERERDRDVELMTIKQSLGCDAVWSGAYIPAYQRKLNAPSSGCKNKLCK